ncbi:Nucleoid-associated protein YbaB [Planctomycetes bacterium CA13]|uniref:Nucleoid-associated protein YbaB n=1 Tax=Novipirellula herctigrandis TaxID=2527986 RepID=A0A5C5Z9U2_9BACT|nr:Nucleoid-associated protein YbaB [Planctomycetes bacterium CA13]
MFKGLGNLGNIASMMGSLQHLPDKMRELNEQMKRETVSGSSSDGLVSVVMNGVGQVQSVQISPDRPDSESELESLVMEATNAAGAAAKQMYADAISQMVNDMDLHVPGLDSILAHLTGG